MDKQKYIITAALTYANGDTHLGHIAGSILPADLYARYRRLRGDDIIFVCGSDEYGTAIEMAAIKENISPREIIDKYHTANKEAYAGLGIAFDIYSRTSLDIHKETAQQFFLDIYNKGILYEKADKQLYSPSEDRFLADRFVIGTCPVCGFEEAQGDQCENCGSALSPLQLINPRSKISGDTPVIKESKHLYFPLSRYQEQLEQWMDKKDNWKPNVVNYCKGWFKTGLQDRAVTRDLKWGVPVPVEEYKDKVLYVWIDAPIGYISATKDLFAQRGTPEKWEDYWKNKDTKLVHFLGKDNIIFHAIIFPSMLMAQGEYVLQDNVPANEFMNIGGQKFSKSKGVGWLVKDVIKEVPPDVVRYAITSVMPENKDSEFSWDDFRVKNNNELAAILGNFVNRTVVFAKSKFDNFVPIRNEELIEESNDDSILMYVRNQKSIIAGLYESYRFKEALTETMNVARAANKYFNDSEPWKVIKDNKEKCGDIINNCLQLCYSIALLISPVLPNTSEKIFKILNVDEPELSWEKIGNVNLESMRELGENIILFPQIEAPADEEKTEAKADTGAVLKAETKSSKKGSKEEAGVNVVNVITIDDFKKVKLATAKVISCEKIEKSQKLLKLQLNAGGREKQIVSGIAEHYTPEELIGKTVVIVDNLKPSKLMGVKSEGMLLAAKQDGKLVLVTVDKEIEPGAEVN